MKFSLINWLKPKHSQPIIVGTYRKKVIDCSITNEIHTKLAQELKELKDEMSSAVDGNNNIQK